MAAISRACTPMTFTAGRSALIAMAIPPMRPPPPTGTSTASRSGHLLQQLEPDGALAGDDARVVEGVDEDQPALGLDLAGAGVGLVEVLPVQDDLGAVAAGGRHLGQRRPLGHDDDGGDRRAWPRGRRPPRPWLPALAATTPRRRSSGESCRSRLAAPRSLKEPVIWRFSSLTKTRAPVSAERVSE